MPLRTAIRQQPRRSIMLANQDQGHPWRAGRGSSGAHPAPQADPLTGHWYSLRRPPTRARSVVEAPRRQLSQGDRLAEEKQEERLAERLAVASASPARSLRNVWHLLGRNTACPWPEPTRRSSTLAKNDPLLLAKNDPLDNFWQGHPRRPFFPLAPSPAPAYAATESRGEGPILAPGQGTGLGHFWRAEAGHFGGVLKPGADAVHPIRADPPHPTGGPAAGQWVAPIIEVGRRAWYRLCGPCVYCERAEGPARCRSVRAVRGGVRSGCGRNGVLEG